MTENKSSFAETFSQINNLNNDIVKRITHLSEEQTNQLAHQITADIVYETATLLHLPYQEPEQLEIQHAQELFNQICQNFKPELIITHMSDSTQTFYTALVQDLSPQIQTEVKKRIAQVLIKSFEK